MAHFAHVVNGRVEAVIVADQEFVDQQAAHPLFIGQYIQTSYNTVAGVHYGPDGNPDGGVALRKNYAAVGMTYDAELDAFIPRKDYPSWTLDEETCTWVPPTPKPQAYSVWNEATQSWEDPA